MVLKKEDIESFKYDGEDDMINFEKLKIPKVNKNFKVTLVLKCGDKIKAPYKWRKKIWVWWYKNRKTEIENDVIIQCANQMLGNSRHGW